MASMSDAKERTSQQELVQSITGNRVSTDYSWLRTFGTICACNLDEAATKHDITILRESAWFQNLDELMQGSIIMAHEGYIGSGCANVAPCLKRNDPHRLNYTTTFWR
jgi:hypothetical protein